MIKLISQWSLYSLYYFQLAYSWIWMSGIFRYCSDSIGTTFILAHKFIAILFIFQLLPIYGKSLLIHPVIRYQYVDCTIIRWMDMGTKWKDNEIIQATTKKRSIVDNGSQKVAPSEQLPFIHIQLYRKLDRAYGFYLIFL